MFLSVSEHARGAETDALQAEHAARDQDIEAQRNALLEIVQSKGGFDAWWDGLEAFRAEVWEVCLQRNAIPTKSTSRMVIAKDDRLFLAYATRQNLCYRDWPKLEFESPEDLSTSPIPVIANFSRQLRERGIDLIYMPVPFTEEVYPDSLTPAAPEDWEVSPQRAQFLLSLLASGVEVLDLLPLYHAEREKGSETLHFYRDNHWSGVGMEVAAKALASRLSRYSFVQQAQAAPARFAKRSITYERRGTFAELFGENRRHEFPPIEYTNAAITDIQGRPYADEPRASVLLIGDSNLDVAGLTQLGVQFSGLLANEINLPVRTLSNQGGFTHMNRTVARKGPGFLNGRKVVVWIGQGLQREGSDWRAVTLP